LRVFYYNFSNLFLVICLFVRKFLVVQCFTFQFYFIIFNKDFTNFIILFIVNLICLFLATDDDVVTSKYLVLLRPKSLLHFVALEKYQKLYFNLTIPDS